jgi:hypothetical protein
MVDGTPIYDIKPYIPYSDAIPDAQAGFTGIPWEPLSVRLPEKLPQGVSAEWISALKETLEQDPRPAYQQDAERVYHLILKPYEVHFRVEDNCAVVIALTPYAK